MLDLLGVANRKRDLHGGKGELERTDGSEREKDRKRRKEREREISTYLQLKQLRLNIFLCVCSNVSYIK